MHILCTIVYISDGVLPSDGIDCSGHARAVNATVQQVECSPAVNTLQAPVVEASWELQISQAMYTPGCYRIVLYRNQSVAYYENFQRTVHQRISTKLLVNSSMSVTECNNIFKAAMNTTRSSTCCLSQFHHLLAVDKDRGSLILHIPLRVNTAEDLLHGTPAICSLTGANGQTANSSFPITIQNSEPNRMHGMCMYECYNSMYVHIHAISLDEAHV